MSTQTIRTILTLSAITLISAAIVHAQSSTTTEVPVTNPADNKNTWQSAQSFTKYTHKLYFVTVDQPNRRQTCHVKSFTDENLVCSRAGGGSHTYPREQVAALILPSDHTTVYWLIGANAAMGASIWGTVVLLSVCPACAVGTGIAAFISFVIAGGVLASDQDHPDQLLYLAPGQHLSGKFAKLTFQN